MGRGRNKAKQVKVARRLKYSGGGTDLDRLRRELGAGVSATASAADEDLAAEFGVGACDDDNADGLPGR
ncbi:DUF3073 domain-containing protein [Actinomadura sp. HBU206391]|nr:DUF3073 domain-containing protein [Actinomadura sp. HBU206391]MBC6461806.1 DUF3073 domain-containing protein [Actinomadura sp. HBU206391]